MVSEKREKIYRQGGVKKQTRFFFLRARINRDAIWFLIVHLNLKKSSQWITKWIRALSLKHQCSLVNNGENSKMHLVVKRTTNGIPPSPNFVIMEVLKIKTTKTCKNRDLKFLRKRRKNWIRNWTKVEK